MSNRKRQFEAGEKQCVGCGEDLPAFESNVQKAYACPKEKCQAEYRKLFTYSRKMKEVREGEIRCQAPGCSKFVPAGRYMARKQRFVCSRACSDHFDQARHIVGTCLCCTGPIHDRPSRTTRKFCSIEHERKYFLENVFREKAGEFEPVLREYLDGAAKNNYKPSTWEGARTNLLNFLAFIRKCGVADLKEVRPKTITSYIRSERDRGLKCDNFIGHISTFFHWLQSEERVKNSPVIPSIHKAKRRSCAPRPVSDEKLGMYWRLLERDDCPQLKAALAIGAESGLRIGEVANLRVGDVNLDGRTIHVRIPNKNDRPRDVPFSDDTFRYVQEWLRDRNPECPTDHLFHNSHLGPYTGTTLGTLFKSHLRMANGAPVPFSFHALRHRWATLLCNAGIEPAVLMVLGGWQSWGAMKFYIKVLKTTVDRSYRSALENIRNSKEEPAERSYSLLHFANIAPASTNSPL